jgi:branched-chain amino acid transport system permease protein
MEALTQAIVAGLLVGGILALLSAGLGLIFGVMRVVNFAQGDFVMLGMYFAFYLYAVQPMNSMVLGFLALPLFAVVAGLLHRMLVGRVTGTSRGAMAGGHDAQLILTLGLSLTLQNGAMMIFGPDPRTLRLPTYDRAWSLGAIIFDQPRTVGFAMALLLSGALFWFLERTSQGRSLRAAADDPEAATYVGVDVSHAHRVAFSIGIALAATGGVSLATFIPMQPFVAWDFIVLMFAAVVLGGMGSILGALVGGLLIGLVQSLSQLFLPLQLQNVAVFGVFLMVLYLRPQGLLGRKLRI